MDSSANLLARHRVILCHFDTYSTALLFVRWPHGSLLAPTALPAAAAVALAPAADASGLVMETEVIGVLQAMGVDTAHVKYLHDFNGCADDESGPVRIHLCRYMTPDAPKQAIAALGGEFKHMSALRAADKQELLLLRQVFDLIMAGGGQ